MSETRPKSGRKSNRTSDAPTKSNGQKGKTPVTTEKGDVDPVALENLPIFPLPQVVLFPRAIMPLHIFEPRYRAMLKDCLATHKTLAIALVGPESPNDPTPAIPRICGIGVIVEHQPLPDGRSNILINGRARAIIEELPFEAPYRRARAKILDDIEGEVTEIDRTSLMATATAFARDVARTKAKFSFRVPPGLPPGAVADMCAHHLVTSAEARQAILEELDVPTRVHKVIAEIGAQRVSLAKDRGDHPN